MNVTAEISSEALLLDIGEDEAGYRVADCQHDKSGHRQAEGGSGRVALDCQQHGADDRADGHDGPYGQVDAAGDDDGGHTGSDQAGDRHLPQYIEQIAVGQEDVVTL